MNISSFLSFFGLAALMVIVPSARASEATALRGRHPTTNKMQPAVRTLQELSSGALKAPLDSGLATLDHPQKRRELNFLTDIIQLLFGGGDNDDDEDDDADGDQVDALSLITTIIGILLPFLTGGDNDNLVLEILKGVLPVLLDNNPLVSIILALIDAIFSGEESLDEDNNRAILADQLEELKNDLRRR